MKDRCYVIAEIGVNHNGDESLARQLIDAAAVAGADAIKFQTFYADELVTRSASKAAYQIANTESDESQYQMLKSLELDDQAYIRLSAYCAERGVDFLSTPFSERAADLLERIGVGSYKVSSGDLTHLPLLRHIAQKCKPVILSSGMGTLSEIEDALSAIYSEGNRQVSVLHCVSNYPAAPSDCNLAAMRTIARAFAIPVGWSDHTMGEAVSLAAVALGASIIEKHITLDRALPGPDHEASMEPAEFSAFVANIRAVESAIGDGRKTPTEQERETAKLGRRSLVTTRAMRAGEELTAADLAILRPGTGIAPRYLPFVIGRRVKVDLDENVPLTLGHLHGG
ncbi:N,N'-diacetyllegionaminic acid synthase [Defluviimonas aquaemixtae]|uniref:N,N'-diacetyllegionaminic acid synthase n=1 Tax=Albidovulum aquaemixtae TaxID=1542388 RepID=A0A2R8B2M5_9RHOB|nr:N-acetylneuraminate synthase [Defluviimonas aquaemixtae]SPH16881.1 N,N'-diacetyllegionaminic acid synthase [Defluviimonas aquaemixtae]